MNNLVHISLSMCMNMPVRYISSKGTALKEIHIKKNKKYKKYMTMSIVI